MTTKNQFTLLLVSLSVIYMCYVISDVIFRTKEQDHLKSKIKWQPEIRKGSNATSGREFKLKRARKFPDNSTVFINKKIIHEDVDIERIRGFSCQKWAVTTTIFEPTESLRRFMYMREWCVVVVADLKKPAKYEIESNFGDNLIFLSVEAQISIGLPFIDSLPWNSFSRKNVGYLYAIANGAKIIWDFDDGNILKFFINDASPDPMLDLEKISNKLLRHNEDLEISSICESDESSPIALNPYPLLGCPVNPCWPRGFPMSLITSSRNVSLCDCTVNVGQIGVLQSLADHQPDVDAIFRLTKKTPFNFKILKHTQRKAIIVPRKHFTPFNAQATLFTEQAFWGLYLPWSVHGRVSDIWRSYAYEAVAELFGIRTVFLPRPLVSQDRNSHSLKADFNAELPLYEQTEALLYLLAKWQSNFKKDNHLLTIPAAIEDLWITLYEFGIIKIQDVLSMQKWLQALLEIGYDFKNKQKGTPVSQDQVYVGKRNFDVGTKISKKDIRPYKCELTDIKKKFWLADLHDGTRCDISTQLQHLNQSVMLAGIKDANLPYPSILNLTDITVLTEISQPVSLYNTHSYEPSNKDIIKNFIFYKDKVIMKDTNAFVCAFPASMCELWVPFNKSIVVIAAHRFNMGRCTPDSFNRWHKKVTELSQDKKNVIGAMSMYDFEYMKYYLNLNNMYLLSSLSGFYTQGHKYNPSEKHVLVVGHNNVVSSLIRNNMSAIYAHRWDTLDFLVSYPAIVYVPYSVMSYKLTEIYSLGIPLLMPSATFLKNSAGIGSDRTIATPPYCDSNLGLNKNMQKHPGSYHPYSPNVEFAEDAEAEMYWLQLADFFHWPHIVHFDNFTHLADIYPKLNLKDISLKMKQSYKIREHQTLEKWCELIPFLD